MDNDEIQHFCSTDSGSSGAPILNFETGKVIGVHFGFNENKKINLGRLLKKPINDFYGLYQSEKNEIIITILINNDDLNKEIYFLDNIKYTDDIVTEKKPDSSLKELSKTNTNIFINDKKMDYSKFFIPETEGIYTIKLEFTIKLTDCQQMFHGCKNITNISLLNFESENVKNMKYMFAGCRNLINIDLSSFNTENVENMSYMLYDCINLEKIDLSTFNTGKVTDMSGLFCGCEKITSLNLNNLNTKNVVNMTHMFYRCENISFLDLTNFDTKNVTNMSGLFAGCLKLNNIDLSKFNTKNVYFMSHLFYDCRKMTNIDLSSFNTKNVDNMNSMFYNCYNLRTVNLSSFDTNNVINMGMMFLNCKLLVNLDLSSFKTSNTIHMYNMFGGCENLYNLDISSFNCGHKDSLKQNNNNFFSSPIMFMFNQSMFQNCKSLRNIKISYADSKNIEFLNDLKRNAPKLETIKVKKF